MRPKKVPWPVRLLKKAGVRSDEAATAIVVVVSVLLIILSFCLFTSSTEKEVRTLTPDQLNRLQQ
jgi:predicted PurR-regulated permease PerM